MQDFDIQLQWEKVQKVFSNNKKEPISIEVILLLIGIQESNILKDIYSKEEKIDLIHIGMCHILLNDGYYKFSHFDNEKWPHYERLKPIPEMDKEDDDFFVKEKIICYCKSQELI